MGHKNLTTRLLLLIQMKLTVS